MTNDDLANALFIISIKLDLAANVYKTAGELEKIKNANAKKWLRQSNGLTNYPLAKKQRR